MKAFAAIMQILIREARGSAGTTAGRSKINPTAVELIKRDVFGTCFNKIRNDKALAAAIEAYQHLIVLDSRNFGLESTCDNLQGLIDTMLDIDGNPQIAFKVKSCRMHLELVCHPYYFV
jgi:hypothetical protein